MDWNRVCDLFLIKGITQSIIAPLARGNAVLMSQADSPDLYTDQGVCPRDKVVPYSSCDVLARLRTERGFLSYWDGNGYRMITGSAQVLFLEFSKVYHKVYMARLAQTYGDKDIGPALFGACYDCITRPLRISAARHMVQIGTQSAKAAADDKGLAYHSLTLQPDSNYGPQIWLLNFCSVFAYRKSMRLGRKFLISLLKDQGDESTVKWLAFTGGVLFAVVVCQPMDTVRHRLMLEDGVKKDSRKYQSAGHCIGTIFDREGVTSFWDGLPLAVMRALGGVVLGAVVMKGVRQARSSQW